MIIIPIILFILILTFMNRKKIEVQGHRGFRGLYPENTIPSFKHAIEIGVDVLELDLQLTKDNIVVIYHDKSINNLLCKNGPVDDIRNLTLEDIKKYDCGSIQNKNFPLQHTIPNTPIPTLSELFDFVKKTKCENIKFNIEIKTVETEKKTYSDTDVIIFVKEVINIINTYNIKNRITIQSEDIRCIKAIKNIDPNISTSFLINAPSNIDMIKIGKQLNVDIISPDFILLNKDLVNKLHKNGFKVIPWTVNDIENYQKMIDMNVDGIITDYPDKLINFLNTDNIIKKFNTFSNTKIYIKIFWICIILHFIISYSLQIYHDKYNNLSCQIIRIFHHFIIPFIYVGFLVPAKYLRFILYFSIFSLITWLINDNKCFLTQIEGKICKTNITTFHDISYYTSSGVDNIIINNRIIFMICVIIILIIRLKNT